MNKHPVYRIIVKYFHFFFIMLKSEKVFCAQCIFCWHKTFIYKVIVNIFLLAELFPSLNLLYAKFIIYSRFISKYEQSIFCLFFKKEIKAKTFSLA